MSNSYDQDHQAIVVNLVEKAVIAHTHAPHIVGATELGAVPAARLAREIIDRACDAALDRLVKPGQLPRCRWQELDRVHPDAPRA